MKVVWTNYGDIQPRLLAIQGFQPTVHRQTVICRICRMRGPQKQESEPQCPCDNILDCQILREIAKSSDSVLEG
jgi:hypothetical protein